MARATCRHKSCITYVSAGEIRELLKSSEEQHGQGYLWAATVPQVPVHVSTHREEASARSEQQPATIWD